MPSKLELVGINFNFGGDFLKWQSLRVVSIIMYILCAMATVMLIIPSFTAVSLSHSEKFITAVIIFAFGYMASRLLCIGVAADIAARIMKTNLIDCMVRSVPLQYNLLTVKCSEFLTN